MRKVSELFFQSVDAFKRARGAAALVVERLFADTPALTLLIGAGAAVTTTTTTSTPPTDSYVV